MCLRELLSQQPELYIQKPLHTALGQMVRGINGWQERRNSGDELLMGWDNTNVLYVDKIIVVAQPLGRKLSWSIVRNA